MQREGQVGNLIAGEVGSRPLRRFVLRKHYNLIGLALFSATALGGFILFSARAQGLGFPLDDAWIHQTYARNLALLGEWSFIPGQPSSGSTAPLWTILLTMGYLVSVNPLIWAYLLGGLCLLGLAIAGQGLFRELTLSTKSIFPWAAVFLIGEWHLVWAAAAGMETILVAFLVLLGLGYISKARGHSWGFLGLFIGLAAWVRPDGITLLGPAMFTLVLVQAAWRKRFREISWLLGGFVLTFGPYLLFNELVQGSIWPNTFYAKQAEYAVMREAALPIRFFNQLTLPLIGSGLFLVPGFIAFGVQAVRQRRWAWLAMILWFFGYAMLYALRLPVTYQYGRYFMPAMPIFFVAGLAGTAILFAKLQANRVGWVIGRVWLLSLVGVWLAFYFVGAGRYAQDVGFIETEMVAVAHWVAENTHPDDLIAAHDIGALGYYSGRDLIDLAGLISPEVIPFMRDEARIAPFLDEQGVRYLVTFPEWYPDLVTRGTLVYQTQGTYSTAMGGENMAVFQWISTTP
jgi:hypothetical protein